MYRVNQEEYSQEEYSQEELLVVLLNSNGKYSENIFLISLYEIVYTKS